MDDLMSLSPDGIQLTPGNVPLSDFKEKFLDKNIPYLVHHGFEWDRIKRKVWEGNTCVAMEGATVHPPTRPLTSEWMEQDRSFETMYGSYGMGTGEGEGSVTEAMRANLPLVVDVSHIFIQLEQGAMEMKTWESLQDYDNIVEVHVSTNQGRHDTHQPMTEDGSFGFMWAKEKMREGTPLVVECYMHKLSQEQRSQQVDWFRS